MRRGELSPRSSPHPDRPLNVDTLIERVRRRHDERAAELGAPWLEWRAYYLDAERRREMISEKTPKNRNCQRGAQP